MAHQLTVDLNGWHGGEDGWRERVVGGLGMTPAHQPTVWTGGEPGGRCSRDLGLPPLLGPQIFSPPYSD